MSRGTFYDLLFLLVLSGALGIAASLLPEMWHSSDPQPAFPSRWHSHVYDGHRFIEVTLTYIDGCGITVVHHPDCPCHKEQP